MKLSKLFHTLYATVMALPVLIIPIFALNILHKETEPISIEVQEKISVDFNQIRENFYNVDTNYCTNNDNVSISVEGNINERTFLAYSRKYDNTGYTFYENHKYAIYNCGNLCVHTPSWELNNNVTGHYEGVFTCTANVTSVLTIEVINTYGQYNGSWNVMITDLTTMYGEGNEPTFEVFISTFNNSYYEPIASQKMLVNKPSPTTYNSTDIGSQFIYALYKPVNDYFNFGEYFGLSGMYDWFQLNIFNGTAPLSFFIVFNVMIYWLFISLFWLLFDILIYVPMVIHKWLDKAEM